MIKGVATTWAQVGAHADLTNPIVTDLVEKLDKSCGIGVAAGQGWLLNLWRQSGNKKTAWSQTRGIN